MKFIVSEKKGPHGALLVITDSDIIGKKFEEKNLQLDLSKGFYQGEEVSEEDVKKIITKAKDLHLTGKVIVAMALSLKFIDPNRILYINNVPHAEIVVG